MDLSLFPYRPDRDAYRLLGVAPNAGRVEIVAACRRLARAFHPDRNGSRRATEEMQVVNAVRSLLGDPLSRAEYDRERISFLAAISRPSPAGPIAPVSAEPDSEPESERVREPEPTPSPRAGAVEPRLSRQARAAMAGMLAALRSLAPAGCGACGARVEPDYRFCGTCGASLRVPASVRPSGSR